MTEQNSFKGKSVEEVVKEKGLVCMFAAMLLGDSKYHPYILMGHFKNELKAFAFNKKFDKYVSCAEDLEKPEVVEDYEMLIKHLRSRIQNLFDSLIAPDLPKDSPMLKHRVDTHTDKYKNFEKEKVCKEFIKNNIVDYGSETVAQIAARLKISKGEVRRRKQNGETL